MVEYKSRSIRDFFSSSQTRPIKRPPPSDDGEERPTRKKSPIESSLTLASSPPIVPPESTPPEDEPPPQEPQVLQAPNGPALPSSQRIVRNGEVMIRNSDDESGSEASSLEDLDKILQRTTKDLSSPPEPQLPFLDSGEQNGIGPDPAKRTLRGRRYGRDSEASPAYAVGSLKTLSLGALAKHRKQYEESKEGVARVNARLEAYRHQQEVVNGQPEYGKATSETSLIDSMLQKHGEEDGLDRLRLAIQRTEALDPCKSWSFFEMGHEKDHAEIKPLPALEDARLASMLQDTSSCQRSFLGGFVREYAMRQPLPEELLLWILDAICLEGRDDIRHSYTLTLMGAYKQIAPMLTSDRIAEIFQKLGANSIALQIDRPIVPRVLISESGKKHGRLAVRSVLDLLRGASSLLSMDARKYAICLMCRLILDHTVFKNHHLLIATEEAISLLLDDQINATKMDKEQELHDILMHIYEGIENSGLRLQLLRHLPAFSDWSVLIRRRLALAWFFDDKLHLGPLPNGRLNLSELSQFLDNQRFTINNATDYANLAASMAILDIAIDAGDRPRFSTNKEEIAFNNDVDLVSAKIKAMFTQILDSGLSNLRRTETKEVLEGMQARFMYSVRTRRPPKNSIFSGESNDDFVRESEVMRSWINAKRNDGEESPVISNDVEVQ